MAIFAKEAYAAGAGRDHAARGALRSRRGGVLGDRGRAAPGLASAARVVLAGLALGAIGYSAQAGFFFGALEHIDASLASLLLYTYPALVFCAAVALRRERATRRRPAPWSWPAPALCSCCSAAGPARSSPRASRSPWPPRWPTRATSSSPTARRTAWTRSLLGALVATGAATTFVGRARGQRRARPGPRWRPAGSRRWRSRSLDGPAGQRVPARPERVGPSTAWIVSTVEPVVTVGLAMAAASARRSVPVQLAGGALVLGAVVLLQARSRVPGRWPCRSTPPLSPQLARSRDEPA